MNKKQMTTELASLYVVYTQKWWEGFDKAEELAQEGKLTPKEARTLKQDRLKWAYKKDGVRESAKAIGLDMDFFSSEVKRIAIRWGCEGAE